MGPGSVEPAAPRRWPSVAGAWLGVGTAPGALLVGAGLAARNGGVPLVSLAVGLLLVVALVGVQGNFGLLPPRGDGASLTGVGRLYFTPAMRRIFGALIAAGMAGWAGVNIGMGASALARLLDGPRWAAVLALGIPISVLAIRGIRGWNRLALVTTACVLGLVALVVWHYREGGTQLLTAAAGPAGAATDVAVIIGYIGVFGLRAPDFTAGLTGRRNLALVISMLAVPMVIIILAGGLLGQRTGSADVIAMLGAPGGLPIGNLLIALAVIAPTFTCFYSGAPALRAATGIGERASLLAFAAVGLGLALAHFDAEILPWLGVLGAVLPPAVAPLVTEYALRRRGATPRAVPVWPWLAGAAPGLALALLHNPFAMITAIVASAVATWLWVARIRSVAKEQESWLQG